MNVCHEAFSLQTPAKELLHNGKTMQMNRKGQSEGESTELSWNETKRFTSEEHFGSSKLTWRFTNCSTFSVASRNCRMKFTSPWNSFKINDDKISEIFEIFYTQKHFQRGMSCKNRKINEAETLNDSTHHDMWWMSTWQINFSSRNNKRLTDQVGHYSH